MRKLIPWWISTLLFGSVAAASLGSASPQGSFDVKADRFADIQVLRYQVPGFDDLTLQQKKLAYYLNEAGLAGRDIFYDQKYRHNLVIRKALETILRSYRGPREGANWDAFLTYAKQVFFANGIHHHYASVKFAPKFTPEYFRQLLDQSDRNKLPLQGKSVAAFAEALRPILFDPAVDAKTVNLDAHVDNVADSANNFYRNVTAEEVEDFYTKLAKESDNPNLSFGLNSQLVKENGRIFERVWKVGGMYGPAIEKIVYWLEKAVTVAENETQKKSLQHLINFYRTGDLAEFDAHCVAWVEDTESRVDFVNGFIEVYADAVGKKGAFESVVSIRDEEATKRIDAISREAQWFEDHSSIADEHKKKDVKGISAKVITVVGEVGDAAPSTPIGINLPNADWIRKQHGSKSVSLGNIVAAYNEVQSKSPATEEFGASPEVIARLRQWGPLASDLHTDMHEVIGHASGQVNPGVGTAAETLKNYANTLEEARADLVALYFTLDPKLVEIGVMPTLEVGKAEYDRYVMNGLMTQLFRVQPGHQLEEAHMRNRQLVAGWAYEKGRDAKVIERFQRDGKTFFRINDYEKLRGLFGELLREIQRIKSEGDYEAGRALVENYGVKVDQDLLNEVHRRYAPLDIAPFSGFIQPRLVPVERNGEIVDVKVEYPSDFVEQMLEYGEKYGLLPVTEPL